jgi:hypothetical protein
MAFLRKWTQSLTISVGLFVAALALTVWLWPMLWPATRPDALHRLARLPVMIGAIAAWGILAVAIARKARWSAQHGAALALLVSSAAFFVTLFVSSDFPGWGGLPIVVWLFCRKVLYSESEWNRTAVAPAEQLTTLHLNS